MRRVSLRGISQHPWSLKSIFFLLCCRRHHVTVEGRGDRTLPKPGLVFRSRALDFLCGARSPPNYFMDLWMQMDYLSFFAVLSSASGSLCDILLTVQ